MESIEEYILKEILDVIKRKEAYKFIKPERKDGYIEMGYYDYNNCLGDIGRIIGSDYNYSKNIDKVKTKEISTLTKEELKTYITYIFRGERFCEGLVARCIDDGTIEKIIERYLELC